MEVIERCGKKRREESSPVSTKCLPQCVCSILSISKAGPPAHSCVVVCSYRTQPYPHTLRTIPAVGVLHITEVGVSHTLRTIPVVGVLHIAAVCASTFRRWFFDQQYSMFHPLILLSCRHTSEIESCLLWRDKGRRIENTYMSVGVIMRVWKVNLRDLHDSDTLGCTGTGTPQDRDEVKRWTVWKFVYFD